MGHSRFEGVIGLSARREVLLGFASAALLHAHSFADVLNEETGLGYQRRFDERHSADFRRYIAGAKSSTIPLTLNIRPSELKRCRLVKRGRARIEIHVPEGFRAFAQVDCQHRLGRLADLDVSLPFMLYLGLTVREEMETFNTINSKARGLQSSLLDYHDAQLSADLGSERPELFIALFLQNEPESPWFKQLDLGGAVTCGMHRRASLRTMQKAVKSFLRHATSNRPVEAEEAAKVVLTFWRAVASSAPEVWSQPRRHLLSKGVGVYALMELAADLVREAPSLAACNAKYFGKHLRPLLRSVDWTNQGPLRGLGGGTGVAAAVQVLRDTRRATGLRAVSHG